MAPDCILEMRKRRTADINTVACSIEQVASVVSDQDPTGIGLDYRDRLRNNSGMPTSRGPGISSKSSPA